MDASPDRASRVADPLDLRILGSPQLTDREGNSIRSVLNRPKRLALLSYLAVAASGTYQRRDKPLALFWPESNERQARSSLSEAPRRPLLRHWSIPRNPEAVARDESRALTVMGHVDEAVEVALAIESLPSSPDSVWEAMHGAGLEMLVRGHPEADQEVLDRLPDYSPRRHTYLPRWGAILLASRGETSCGETTAAVELLRRAFDESMRYDDDDATPSCTIAPLVRPVPYRIVADAASRNVIDATSRGDTCSRTARSTSRAPSRYTSGASPRWLRADTKPRPTAM